MINKIITNKYKKIVLRIINNLDPMDKHYGRPCKHNYNAIKKIIKIKNIFEALSLKYIFNFYNLFDELENKIKINK